MPCENCCPQLRLIFLHKQDPMKSVMSCGCHRSGPEEEIDWIINDLLFFVFVTCHRIDGFTIWSLSWYILFIPANTLHKAYQYGSTRIFFFFVFSRPYITIGPLFCRLQIQMSSNVPEIIRSVVFILIQMLVIFKFASECSIDDWLALVQCMTSSQTTNHYLNQWKPSQHMHTCITSPEYSQYFLQTHTQ